MGLRILLAVPFAYIALKVFGGLYLLWLAYKIIKHAKEPMEAMNGTVKTMSYTQAFRLGLITQLSNPKIAIILASILLRYYQKKFQLILCGVADAVLLY